MAKKKISKKSAVAKAADAVKKTVKKAVKKPKDEMKGVKVGEETILINEAPKPIILK